MVMMTMIKFGTAPARGRGGVSRSRGRGRGRGRGRDPPSPRPAHAGVNEMHKCRRGFCVRLQYWSPDADGDTRTIRILSVSHEHVKGKRLHGIYAG